MGMSQGAIVFRNKAALSPEEVVQRLFKREITNLQVSHLDTRKPYNTLVERYDDVWVISSSDLVHPVLENPSKGIGIDLAALGNPELVVAFCIYSTSDTHGFAIIENGVLKRSRFQVQGEDVIEYGDPQPFEHKWLTADYYYEEEDDDLPEEERAKVLYINNRQMIVMEDHLTMRLAVEALEESFGFCPWITNQRPLCTFLHLGDELTSTPGSDVAIPHRKAKPWWKIW